MKTLFLLIAILLPATLYADSRHYGVKHYGGSKEIKIYGTQNGFTDYLSGPKAIIEVDPYNDTATVYKTGPFGHKDTFSGPIGVAKIERDSGPKYLSFDSDDCPFEDSNEIKFSKGFDW